MELGKHERKVSGREALEEKQMVRYVEKRWLLMSFFFFFFNLMTRRHGKSSVVLYRNISLIPLTSDLED